MYGNVTKWHLLVKSKIVISPSVDAELHSILPHAFKEKKRKGNSWIGSIRPRGLKSKSDLHLACVKFTWALCHVCPVWPHYAHVWPCADLLCRLHFFSVHLRPLQIPACACESPGFVKCTFWVLSFTAGAILNLVMWLSGKNFWINVCKCELCLNLFEYSNKVNREQLDMFHNYFVHSSI